MTTIPFTKMEGAGNDFILVDNRDAILGDIDRPALAADLCRRALGIGADGLILIEKADDPALDFRWDFYNADGSAAEMCGNGARCAARFAHAIGAAGESMTFGTLAGPIRAWLTEDGARVQLTDATAPVLHRDLDAAGRRFDAYLLNTGVPHAVVPVDDLEAVDVEGWGRPLRFHAAFGPAGANVNFLARDGGKLALRTYERGVEGETLACGTGSVASAIVASELWNLPPPLSLRTRSGLVLTVDFTRDGDRVTGLLLEGPARVVFTGNVAPPGSA